MTEVAVAGKPEPFMEGTFALYNLPDGSMVVAYRKKGGEPETIMIPGFVVQMAGKMAADGNPLDMLKAMAG